MTRKVPVVRLPTAAAIVALGIPLALSGCTAKPMPPSDATDAIHVATDETTCTAGSHTATTGNVTFEVDNVGRRVTEFYVYATGDRVLGEVENIAPGQRRRIVVAVTDPGSYQISCRPGMSGPGIRHAFTVTGDTVSTTGGPLIAAADDYRRYLVGEVNALRDATASFVAAVTTGDLTAARRQYATTRTHYERVEPVAEGFPYALDSRLDLRKADLAPGSTWTGFHRIEEHLWTTGSTMDPRIADQLVADVDELLAGVTAPQFTVDAVHVAGGAQTLLDEIARTKVTGEEDVYSHTDLWDFQANVDGCRAALASVRPILDTRNPLLGRQIDRRFIELDAELGQYRTSDGYVRYDGVDQAHRTALSRRIDALSAAVSQVQPVIAQG